MGRALQDFKVSIYKGQTLTALEEAERVHGGPVTYLQIYKVYVGMDHYRIPLVFPAIVLFALLDLYMDDRVLADKEVLHFSLIPEMQHREDSQTDYMLYSDRIRQAFPGYQLDERNRVVPGPDTPTLNFDHVK